jgi:hypothetical protein
MRTASVHPMGGRANLTVVVNSCDAYTDVLSLFFCALHEYWPDCPHPIVVNTESPTYSKFARVHHHRSSSGQDNWGERLLLTLSSIDSEYVLMVCDDFILDSEVHGSRIDAAVSALQSNPEAAAVYLIDTQLPIRSDSPAAGFGIIDERAEYRLNSAPGVWRRSALMKYTRTGDNPWAWEVFGTYRTRGDGSVFLTPLPGSGDIFPYNYRKGGAIYRGKWVREVVRNVERYNLGIDWNQRGFSSDVVFEKRSFRWKVDFLLIGFRMVGFKAFSFLPAYLRGKMNAR